MAAAAVQMEQFGELLLTRERGRQVATKLPRRKELELDFEGVEAASPSFLDELIRRVYGRGTATVVFYNISERTAETLQRLRRIDENPARDLEVQVG